MAYKALTYLVLGDVRKSPGDSISDKELKDAGQEEDNIQALIDSGALGDKDAEIHPDHVMADPEASEGSDNNVNASDAGGGKE